MIRLSIRRPIFVLMLTLFFLTVGGLALRALPVDLYPSVSYPVLAIRTLLPGAAPEEVEQLVTKKLENALSTVAGLSTLRSTSREGNSQIVLEFGLGVDVRFQEVQVRGIVGNLLASLPKNAVPPTVYRQDPDATPIVELAVTGERTIAEVSVLARDEVARRLSQIPGVGQVDLVGARMQEIQVEVRPEALARWRLNIDDVVAAIGAFNQNMPAGRLEGDQRLWLLRFLSKAATAYDLGEIPVGRAAAGQPVFLRDVAVVRTDFEKILRTVSFGEKGTPAPTPAVVLNILKQSGENTVAVSAAIREAIPAILAALPADMRLTVTRDNADLVRSNVADVSESLVLGAILTVVVVLLFLRSPRSTVTTGLSLPSSVITTFAVMFAVGFTVNVMTLLALSLAVGLLVDDAIVVRENIFRHLQIPGKDAKTAAIDGASEVALAVVATTLTIVAVFLPVGFMGGVSGQFFRQFALTVVFAVLVSLWDALTMAPMLSAYFANIPDPAREWAGFGAVGRGVHGALHRFERLFDRLAALYGRLLRGILPRPWVAALIAAVAVGGAVWGFVRVKKSFLPAQLGTVFNISMDGPLAVPAERGVAFGQEIEARLRAVDGLENWTVRAGADPTGRVSVDVTCRVAAAFAADQNTLNDVRQRAEAAVTFLPGFIVDIEEPSDPLAGSTGSFQPLAVVVSGDDLTRLSQVAEEVRAAMLAVDGIVGAAPIMAYGLPEVRLKSDPVLTAQFGLDARKVGTILQTWVDGDVSNSIDVGEDVVPIRVQLAGGRRRSPAELLQEQIFSKDARGRTIAVPVANLVSVGTGAGAATITRENRTRILRIGGTLAKGAALGDVVDRLRAKLAEVPLPRGYATRIVGQNQQMSELFANVSVAIGVGAVFVYMILAALFESFLQPLTVMAAIPLAASGAVLSLLATSSPLDLYAGIGLILLAGIVAKNSILLVDFARQRVRDRGERPRQAIEESAPLRLRPIVMTSVAMIVGMIPVAASIGSGGEARRTLGIATIGGVLSSTILTLVVVPSLYVAISRLELFLARRSGAAQGR